MARKIRKDGTVKTGVSDDNVIQPFQLDETGLRGRMVKLGSVLDRIISQHQYPQPVSHLLGESITLCLLLGGMLKYDGIFTLQIKGDGPVSTIVTDMTSEGVVRGYAQYDRSAFENLTDIPSKAASVSLLGKGYIAFTVDQGEHMETYQGIVELKGDDMADCVGNYFTLSEQIKTGLKLAVEHDGESWRSGAIMLQKMPEDNTGKIIETPEAEEDWNRSNIFLESCTNEELLSEKLHTADVLYRLYHEEGVRVYDPKPVVHGCRCNRDKLLDVLATLPKDDLEHCIVDGKISSRCEFCGKVYEFGDKDLSELRKD